MAIPKHTDDVSYGDSDASDNYYVDIDVDIDSSSPESESELGESLQDTGNYLEIESCRQDQFESIKGRILDECSDVRNYSFVTKYLPGLASLFETGGAYDADHYLAKLRSSSHFDSALFWLPW